MRSSSLLILMLILVAPLTTTINTETSGTPIKWVRYINPTDKNYFAHGTCIFRGYIAVAGGIGYTLPSNIIALHPYIVLLDRDSGEIVREWISEEIGGFYNCISIGDKLYVVGQTISVGGVIYVFDENLNIVKTANSMNNHTGYTSIIYDGSYIYIGGESSKDIDGNGYDEVIWLIEKRTVDLDLVSSRETYLSPWYLGHLRDIDVNPVTGDIWAVGMYSAYLNQTNIDHSLIAILNNNLSNVKLIDYPKGHKNYLVDPNSICFDNNGYAYIASLSGIAKFDPQGNLVTVNKNLKNSIKILCINSSIYIFTTTYIDGYHRHVLTVLDSDLNIVDEYVLSRDVDTISLFTEGRASFDGENIYVAGVDEALGENNWRIVVYSIAIEPLQPSAHKTIAKTSATIITTTQTPITTATSPTLESSINIQPSTSIATPVLSTEVKQTIISPTTPQTTTQGTQITGLQLYIALIVVGAVAVVIIAILILKK